MPARSLRARLLRMLLPPVAALLVLCALLCVLANPAMAYLQDAAAALHAPTSYMEEVLRR